MDRLGWTLRDIDGRYQRVLDELHPDLRRLVDRLLAEVDDRLVPYEGYRDERGQARALAAGRSNAAFGQSPHNYRPALACDLVLDPRRVRVLPHRQDPRYPDLWCTRTPEAKQAWADLHSAALRVGLERVRIRDKAGRLVIDLPHVQLYGWRGRLPAPTSTTKG